MKIITDTHSLIWHLSSNKKLSPPAKEAILEAEQVFVPTITLLEGLWISKRYEFENQFKYFISKLPTPIFQPISLDLKVIEQYLLQGDELEMHDRIIAATAQLYGLPIVTRDETITKLYSNVIW